MPEDQPAEIAKVRGLPMESCKQIGAQLRGGMPEAWDATPQQQFRPEMGLLAVD